MYVPGNVSSVNRTQGSGSVKVNSELDKAARGMEKIFIKFFLDELRKSESTVDIFGSKKGNSFFENELYNEYARLMTERGDFGLAEMIRSQVEKTLSAGRTK